MTGTPRGTMTGGTGQTGRPGMWVAIAAAIVLVILFFWAIAGGSRRQNAASTQDNSGYNTAAGRRGVAPGRPTTPTTPTTPAPQRNAPDNTGNNPDQVAPTNPGSEPAPSPNP